MQTYRCAVVNLVDPSHSLGGFHDSYCLDRNWIPKAFTLAVDYTWCKYVSTHAMLFTFFNDCAVGIDSLRSFESGIFAMWFGDGHVYKYSLC